MFSDALDREAAWLNTSGDSLPALPVAAGGPFQIIQARWPRVAAARKRAIYVLRQAAPSYHLDRFSSQRTMSTTGFQLRLFWPLSQGTGSGETEQQLFEQGIDLVIQRVAGPLGDKTHGGRFLQVAENRAGITVAYDDPEQATQGGIFRAQITYSADDTELIN